MTSSLNFLAAFVGYRIEGGCDDCDAYQTVNVDDAPVYRVTVHHDADCPTLARMEGTSQPKGSRQ